MNSAPTVWLNGRFLPAAEATISVFDRSFLYGDGLFETIRVSGNRPFLWAEHLARLQAGAARLQLRLPSNEAELSAIAAELLQHNDLPESVLRLHLSRGVGRRGYSPRGADSPTLVLTQHPATPNDPAAPVRWSLVTSSVRLPTDDGLSAFKTANKLAQVVAKAEADDRGADEALLLNSHGQVVEGTGSNVFWITDGQLFTPPLTEGPLPGVTRGFTLELARHLRLPMAERACRLADLQQADGVFLTLSSLGIVPATRLDDQPLRESPLTAQLQQSYEEAIRRWPHGLAATPA